MWTGYCDREGYGRIGIDKRARGAHQVAWELAHGGPMPAGMEPDHLCFVAGCVRDSHLEAVTPEENQRRAMVARGYSGVHVHTTCGNLKRRTRRGEWVCGRCRADKAREKRAIQRVLREDW